MCSTKNAIGFVGGNPKGSCRRCLLLSSSSHHHHHHDYRSVLLLLLLLLPWFFLLCYRWLSLKKLICSFGVPLLEIFRFLLLEVFVLRALSLSPLLSSRDFFNFTDGGLKNVRWWRPRNRESVSAKGFFAFGVFFSPDWNKQLSTCVIFSDLCLLLLSSGKKPVDPEINWLVCHACRWRNWRRRRCY